MLPAAARTVLSTLGEMQASKMSKPAPMSENTGALISSSVPDDTGENEDGCSWGKDGDPNCHVQSWHWSDVDAAEGSSSGNRQMSCTAALNQAGKTQGGLTRAQADLPKIKQEVGDDNIARLLAAIGVQESDFQDVKQAGNGPGRGIFQIEPKTYGITEAQARSLPNAVNAIANNWARSWTDELTAPE
jgi:hypothetical protein